MLHLYPLIYYSHVIWLTTAIRVWLVYDQYTEEKLGQAEATEYDAHLDNLIQKADRTKYWTERVLSQTETVLQPNPSRFFIIQHVLVFLIVVVFFLCFSFSWVFSFYHTSSAKCGNRPDWLSVCLSLSITTWFSPKDCPKTVDFGDVKI